MTTIAGVRFSDALAALLDQAISEGFRVEPDTRARSRQTTGVIVYPPDREQPPIPVHERGVNPAHIDNVRRALIRAGMQDLRKASAEEEATPIEETAVPPTRRKQQPKPVDLGMRLDITDAKGMTQLLTEVPPEQHEQLATAIVGSLADALDLDSVHATLACALFVANLRAARERSSNERLVPASDLEEAMRIAQETEHRAVTAERAAEKAKREGAATGEKLTEAIARAEAAERKARELEAALAPLRSLLTGTAAG